MIRSVADVAAKQMCCGCGVCAYLSPAEIEMVDVVDHGRRPRFLPGAPRDARSEEALRACPGIRLEHRFDRRDPRLLRGLAAAWGPIRGVFEGHAADPELRFAGSSGGAASALSLYAIERRGFHGVLHVAARPDAPYLNRTVLSRSRAEILAATGSRYAPASPCDGLQSIEDAPGPCVFVGKPCDVAAVASARRVRPGLDRKLGLTIAFFCAGTPSTRGTIEMLRRMGIEDLASVTAVRYRGNGWPGRATVRIRTERGEEERSLSYDESWGGSLERHRQWRCYVCADHTGEFADVAVGDPWYRPIPPDEPGRSLVLARTEGGEAFLRGAIEAGYVVLESADPGILPASQPNLLGARGAAWGRSLTSRLLGAAAPRFRGMPIFSIWWSALSLREKTSSIAGTAKRVFRKGLRGRVECVPWTPPPPRRSPADTDSRSTA
jgi:coenzyme F420 hydrogenase subunit beta